MEGLGKGGGRKRMLVAIWTKSDYRTARWRSSWVERDAPRRVILSLPFPSTCSLECMREHGSLQAVRHVCWSSLLVAGLSGELLVPVAHWLGDMWRRLCRGQVNVLVGAAEPGG